MKYTLLIASLLLAACGQTNAPNTFDSVTKKAGQKAEPKGLVKQAHGGAIYQGPPANPVAGTGRPPNQLRDAMRTDLDKLLPGLWRKYETGQIDALDFANFLAKYGLGTKDELDVMSHPDAQRFAAAYREALASESPEVYERVMDRVAQALGRTT